MSSRREKDLLTPYKISVMLYIEKYGSLRPKFWESENENDLSLFSSGVLTLPPIERRATCILVSNLIQGCDISLSELIDLVESSNVLTLHTTTFINGLQELYRNGIEALLSLFESVEKFCSQDQPRSETSPCLLTSLVGLHLRQLNLVFRRLTFSHVISLYQKYRSYYEICYKSRPSMLEESSIPYVKDKSCTNAFEESKSQENVTDENNVDMEETSLSIGDDGSSLMKETASPKSSKPLSQEREKGQPQLKFILPSADVSNSPPSKSRRPPVKTRQQAELFIQEQISLLLQQNPSALPPPQLQQILSSILKNCPDLGKGHFLSYLNCLRVREHSGAVHSLVRAYDSKLMQKDLGKGDDITRTFRYAALNMAALQAQFGHRDLGLISLEEAIRLAQESSDHVCLQYALSWLYSLSKTHKLILMRRSLTRCSDMNLSYLSWLSLLNYTIELSRSKMPPAHILKRLLGPLSPTSQNRTSMEGGLAGQSGLWAVQSGLWAIWGNITLTATCSQLVLHMTPYTTSCLHAPSTASPTCAALCNMALILANLGEFTLSGEVLHHAQEQYPSPWEHSKHWMFAQCYITFYETLRQGLWSQAKVFAVNMATIHSSYSKLLEAELLVAEGEYGKALEMTADMTVTENELELSGDIKEPLGEPEIMVKVLLVEAEALAGGNNLGGAMSTLVKAVAMAQEYHMAYLVALTQLQMACVQMHLGLLNEATLTLDKGMDVILSGGGIYDQARARLLQAKLEVCCANKTNYNDKLLNAALELEEAQKLFLQVKAFQREKETVYLKARFYHASGRIEERNRSALEFKQLEQHHPLQPIVANTCVF